MNVPRIAVKRREKETAQVATFEQKKINSFLLEFVSVQAILIWIFFLFTFPLKKYHQNQPCSYAHDELHFIMKIVNDFDKIVDTMLPIGLFFNFTIPLNGLQHAFYFELPCYFPHTHTTLHNIL